MAALKRPRAPLYLLAAALAPALSAWAAAGRSLPLLLAAVGGMFLFVACAPVCRRHESQWVFLLTALTGIGPNLTALAALLRTPFFADLLPLTGALYGALCYIVLFSLEEIVLGVAARCLWREQADLLAGL